MKYDRQIQNTLILSSFVHFILNFLIVNLVIQFFIVVFTNKIHFLLLIQSGNTLYYFLSMSSIQNTHNYQEVRSLNLVT